MPLFFASKAGCDLSEIERADRDLPESAFLSLPTSHPEMIRASPKASLAEVVAGIVAHNQKTAVKKEKSIAPGSPILLVVCGSAIRCVNVIREIDAAVSKKTGKGKRIAKLFAKHFKLAEQLHFLQTNAIDVAVGTPARISALIDATADAKGVDNGSCSPLTDRLAYVVVDASHKDASKNLSMLEIEQVFEELFALVHNNLFQTPGAASRIKIALL